MNLMNGPDRDNAEFDLILKEQQRRSAETSIYKPPSTSAAQDKPLNLESFSNSHEPESTIKFDLAGWWHRAPKVLVTCPDRTLEYAGGPEHKVNLLREPGSALFMVRCGRGVQDRAFLAFHSQSLNETARYAEKCLSVLFNLQCPRDYYILHRYGGIDGEADLRILHQRCASDLRHIGKKVFRFGWQANTVSPADLDQISALRPKNDPDILEHFLSNTRLGVPKGSWQSWWRDTPKVKFSNSNGQTVVCTGPVTDIECIPKNLGLAVFVANSSQGIAAEVIYAISGYNLNVSVRYAVSAIKAIFGKDLGLDYHIFYRIPLVDGHHNIEGRTVTDRRILSACKQDVAKFGWVAQSVSKDTILKLDSIKPAENFDLIEFFKPDARSYLRKMYDGASHFLNSIGDPLRRNENRD